MSVNDGEHEAQELFSLTVLGAGAVHGLGGCENLWALRRAGAEPALEGPLPPPDLADLPQLLPGISLRRVPRYARMGLLAAARVLAAWDGPPPAPEHTALVLGTAYSGVEMSMDFMDSMLDAGPRLSSPTAFSHAVNNMGAGLLSLALALRGPCCTVSQFELSFAGALSAAATLLRAGRAKHALVGAVDETDTRFARACPAVAQGPCATGEGAVFLLVAADGPERLPHLVTRWNAAMPPDMPLLLSGLAEKNVASGVERSAAPQRWERLYGRTPLAQAFDTLLGLDMLSDKSAPAERMACLCAEAHGGRALIELWRK